MNFFTKDTPLNDHDEAFVATIEHLPVEAQIDAIDALFSAIVREYNNASEEQRLTMSPFCKFFAELDCEVAR